MTDIIFLNKNQVSRSNLVPRSYSGKPVVYDRYSSCEFIHQITINCCTDEEDGSYHIFPCPYIFVKRYKDNMRRTWYAVYIPKKYAHMVRRYDIRLARLSFTL